MTHAPCGGGDFITNAFFFFFQNPFGSVFPFVEYYQNKICHKTLGGREKPKDTGKAKDKDSERAEV